MAEQQNPVSPQAATGPQANGGIQKRQPIDFGAIWDALKRHRKLFYKTMGGTFVVACLMLISMPNYYTSTVKLSPELSGSSSSLSGLASIASSFGFDLASGSGPGTEALFPTLYPDLMNSVDFKTSLFHIPITPEGEQTVTYYNYIKDHQRKPWWSSAIEGLMSLLSKQKPEPDSVNPFRLTKKQDAVLKAINQKVACSVDKKTMVITIDVTDQDALVSAVMADSVKERLQAFITEYRTSKARVDLEYNRKLYAEAKARYDRSRQLYATFCDANQDVILQSVRQRQVELENEMQLQYNAYTQVAAQLLKAEAKVQEVTPAFTTLQSATVPVRKAGPARSKLALMWTFLAAIVTAVWVLQKEKQLLPLLGLS